VLSLIVKSIHMFMLCNYYEYYTRTHILILDLSCVDVTENSVKNALQVKDTFIRV
jgi:hypothetical protein